MDIKEIRQAFELLMKEHHEDRCWTKESWNAKETLEQTITDYENLLKDHSQLETDYNNLLSSNSLEIEKLKKENEEVKNKIEEMYKDYESHIFNLGSKLNNEKVNNLLEQNNKLKKRK